VPTNEALDSNLKPLLGADDAVIDDKGRVLISTKKRERLQPGFTVCLGDNGCLYAYPKVTWDALVKQVLSFDVTNQGRRQYTHLVFGYAEDELNCDQQGRVVIPRRLREKAKLKEKIKVVGCGDRVEIWAEEEFEKYELDPEGYGKERKDAIRSAWIDMRIQ